MRKIIAYASGSGVLLVAAVIVLLVGLGTPPQKQQQVTRVNYQITSDFTQHAQGVWSSGSPQASPIFFPQIINSVTGSYTYNFQPQTPLTDVNTHVQISAILSNSDLWQKEIVVLPEQDEKGSFHMDFPLDLAAFQSLSNQINKEIGAKSDTVMVTLVAAVRVQGTAPSGAISDNFDQDCSFTLSPLTMEWNPPFELDEKGYQNGVFYSQQGIFGYAVDLKANSLYTASTVKSEPPPADALHNLPQSTTYSAKSLKDLDINFTCSLTADQTVQNVDYQAEVTGVLANPDGPQLQFALLPSQHFDKDVNVDMPLNAGFIYDTIDKLGDSGIDFQLTVTAKVLVTAQSNGQTISKTVTNSIPIDFNVNSVGWPDKTNTSLSDSIKETVSVPNNARPATLTGSYALGGFTFAMLLLTTWIYVEDRKRKQVISPAWAAAQNLMEKRKSVITDVVALPAPEPGEKVIPVGSLSELVKLSDALLKPVLHQANDGVHAYAVIDGSIRFQYLLSEKGDAQSSKTT